MTMSLRALSVFVVTVVSCWLLSLASAHSWDVGPPSESEEIGSSGLWSSQNRMSEKEEESLLKSFIIRRLSDRIRSQLKILEEMDLDTESAEQTSSYTDNKSWEYPYETRAARGPVKRGKKGKCFGRFVPVLTMC